MYNTEKDVTKAKALVNRIMRAMVAGNVMGVVDAADMLGELMERLYDAEDWNATETISQTMKNITTRR